MQIELINQDLIIIETEIVKCPNDYPILRNGDTVESVSHVHIISLKED